jgi:pyrophosphatase PpaX
MDQNSTSHLGGNPLAYRAVLFDLDGTLVDTSALIIASFEHTFRRYVNRVVPREEILARFGEPLLDTMRHYAASDAEAREMVEYYRAHNLREHDVLARAFPGARACLEALRDAGVAVGLVTSKQRQTALRSLALDNLEPLFDTLVCVEDCAEHKPHPAPILLALDRLNITADEGVLMVGDTAFDILAGQRAGVRTAGVLWSTQVDEIRVAGPDLLVPDFMTLLAACLAGGGA